MILSNLKKGNYVMLFASASLSIGFFSPIAPFQCYMLLLLTLAVQVGLCIREMIKYNQQVDTRLLLGLWLVFIITTIILFFIGVKIYLG